MRANLDDKPDYDLSPTDGKEKTAFGGFSGAGRSWVYFFVCVVAIGVLAATFYNVDRRLDAVLNTLSDALRVDELAHTVERGTYSLQARQRSFILTRDIGTAEGFAADLADVSAALDELFALEMAEPLGQDVTTIRDGLVQYDQQFQAFVNTEREIGIGNESGLSARLGETSAALKDAFTETGNRNLINQIERIDQQGQETILSGSKIGVEEIQRRYRALIAFLDASSLSTEQRQRIDTLMRMHETQMLAMINARFDLAGETRRFEELFEYVVPSLQSIVGFSSRNRIEAAADVRGEQLFGRYTLASASVAVLLWLLFFGLLLLKSLSGPAKRLADAIERITRGAPYVELPALGNRDDFGRLARMLDGWAETIVAADQLRADLERVQVRLDSADGAIETANARALDAERRAETAETAANDARSSERHMREQLANARSTPPSPPDPVVRRQRETPPPVPLEVSDGPISSVSQQLQNFTQYVTAAANDVERTEALIKGLEHLGMLVNDIGDLIIVIRDQTNLLAFRSPGREALRSAPGDDDNLVPFGQEIRPGDAERAYTQRFEHLREAADQTERTALRIRDTLNEVQDIARGIAETASHQALEATHKLLNQSEYLQNMLDDILHKVQPAQPGELSADRPRRQSSDDPFA